MKYRWICHFFILSEGASFMESIHLCTVVNYLPFLLVQLGHPTNTTHKIQIKLLACCLWYRALLFNLGSLHFPSDEIRKDIEEQAEFQKQQMIAASQVIDPYNDPGNTLINMTTQGNHDNLESLDVNDFIQHFIQKNYSKLVNWVVTRNWLV